MSRHFPITKILINWLMILFALSVVNPTRQVQALGVVFVTPGGTGDCSQASPCNLSVGLSTVDSGGTLYAAAGTYTGSGNQVVWLNKTINLLGGWNDQPEGTPFRDPDTYESIIDGENLRRGINIVGSQPVVDGWTIQGGNASGLELTGCYNPWGSTSGCGGGINVYNADPTISHNIIRDNNAAIGMSNYGGGGGIYIYGSNGAIIESNEFYRNDSHLNGKGNGGAVYIVSSGGTVEISDNDIYENEDSSTTSYDHSGVGILIYYNTGQILIHGNNIHDNNPNDEDYWGIGVELVACTDSVILEQNRIISNNGSNAIHLEQSVATIQQNTIINPDLIVGILLSGAPSTGGTVVIRNNIIAENSINVYITGDSEIYTVNMFYNTISNATSGIFIANNADVVVDSSIITNHGTGITVGAGPGIILNVYNTLFNGNGDNGVIGTNPLYGDPLYADPTDHDYHVRWNSAAIDRLPVDGLASVDIDGDPRPMGFNSTPYDVGADEFWWKYFAPMISKP